MFVTKDTALMLMEYPKLFCYLSSNFGRVTHFSGPHTLIITIVGSRKISVPLGQGLCFGH